MVIPQFISWMLISFAKNSTHLFFSRFLSGFAGASVVVVLPQFVAEISNDNVRGFLGSILVLAVNLGVLSAYILGTFVNYDVVSSILSVVSIVFLILFCSVPDSPFIYARNGNYEVDYELELI